MYWIAVAAISGRYSQSFLTMMSHSSTPFKVLENLGDENDSTVMKKSLRGSRAIDLPSKGISVFRDVTKPNSVSNVAKSSRKPLLDLSKGQLNSRLTGISIKSDSIEKGIARKPKSQLSSTHNIPKSISSKTSDAENQKGHAGFELVRLKPLHSCGEKSTLSLTCVC